MQRKCTEYLSKKAPSSRSQKDPAESYSIKVKGSLVNARALYCLLLLVKALGTQGW